jgi:hypothetical protein
MPRPPLRRRHGTAEMAGMRGSAVARYPAIVLRRDQDSKAARYMRTVSLLAHKSGTGKITLAVHLAVLAGEDTCRVLLVDSDQQRSAGDWGWARRGDTPQVVECAAKRVPAVLQAAERDGVDLWWWIPGQAWRPTRRRSPACPIWC